MSSNPDFLEVDDKSKVLVDLTGFSDLGGRDGIPVACFDDVDEDTRERSYNDHDGILEQGLHLSAIRNSPEDRGLDSWSFLYPMRRKPIDGTELERLESPGTGTVPRTGGGVRQIGGVPQSTAIGTRIISGPSFGGIGTVGSIGFNPALFLAIQQRNQTLPSTTPRPADKSESRDPSSSTTTSGGTTPPSSSSTREKLIPIRNLDLESDARIECLVEHPGSQDLFPFCAPSSVKTTTAARLRGLAAKDNKVDWSATHLYRSVAAPMPRDAISILTRGTEEESLDLLEMPVWQGILVSDQRSREAPRRSTRVVDLDSEGNILMSAVGGLQSAFRLEHSFDGRCAVAWECGTPPGGRDLGKGLFRSDGLFSLGSDLAGAGGRLALAGESGGGPLSAGNGTADVHHFGNNVVQGHINGLAPIYMGPAYDAPYFYDLAAWEEPASAGVMWRCFTRLNPNRRHPIHPLIGANAPGYWETEVRVPLYVPPKKPEDTPEGGGGEPPPLIIPLRPFDLPDGSLTPGAGGGGSGPSGGGGRAPGGSNRPNPGGPFFDGGNLHPFTNPGNFNPPALEDGFPRPLEPLDRFGAPRFDPNPELLGPCSSLPKGGLLTPTPSGFVFIPPATSSMASRPMPRSFDEDFDPHPDISGPTTVPLEGIGEEVKFHIQMPRTVDGDRPEVLLEHPDPEGRVPSIRAKGDPFKADPRDIETREDGSDRKNLENFLFSWMKVATSGISFQATPHDLGLVSDLRNEPNPTTEQIQEGIVERPFGLHFELSGSFHNGKWDRNEDEGSSYVRAGTLSSSTLFALPPELGLENVSRVPSSKIGKHVLGFLEGITGIAFGSPGAGVNSGKTVDGSEISGVDESGIKKMAFDFVDGSGAGTRAQEIIASGGDAGDVRFKNSIRIQGGTEFDVEIDSPSNTANRTQTTQDKDGIIALLSDIGGAGTVDLNFGDGSDGDVVIAGSVNITRDMFYKNLTIQAGGVLRAFEGGAGAAFKIHVSEKLTVDFGGVINVDGFGGFSNFPGVGHAQGTVGASSAGGAGQIGNGSNGVALTLGLGGIGGVGGNGSGGVGGVGGTLTAAVQIDNLINAIMLRNVDLSLVTGGTGGGGAAGDGIVQAAGAGAGGGGILAIYAAQIENNGVISADGGIGAPGQGPNTGSGSGGGGGLLVVLSSTAIASRGTGVFRAVGGIAGFPVSGTGTLGTAGAAGKVFQLLHGAQLATASTPAVPVPVQVGPITAAHVAVANTVILTDSSGGSFPIDFPDAIANVNSVITVKDNNASSSGVNSVLLRPLILGQTVNGATALEPFPLGTDASVDLKAVVVAGVGKWIIA